MPETLNPAGAEALDAEDGKLVTLSRSARGRTGAVEGAAVRDTDGRTYNASTVALPSLSLSALQLAVAQAVSAGAPGLEAAALVTEGSAVDDAGLAAVRDLSAKAPVFLAGPDGVVLGSYSG
ncbi:MAG: cytidine deaminase [Actinocatenispora sp.]